MTTGATRTFFLSFLLLLPAMVNGAAPATRIVSLSPHLTELAFDAGAGPELVGAVEYSDHPAAARMLPRVGDAFRIDRETLASLEPDLILAWAGGTPTATVEQLRRDGYRVVMIETGDPEEVAAALEKIAELAGTEDTAAPLAEAFRAGFSDLRRRFADRSPVRVFVQISPRPLYTVGAGQIIDSVLTTCGGRNVFGEIEQLAPVVTDEAVIAADPQVIIAPSVGAEDVLTRWHRYPGIAAVRSGRLHIVEGDLLSRQSLRLLEGAREICALLDEARGGA
jgi:iron complex transport system substrate-binding protein